MARSRILRPGDGIGEKVVMGILCCWYALVFILWLVAALLLNGLGRVFTRLEWPTTAVVDPKSGNIMLEGEKRAGSVRLGPWGLPLRFELREFSVFLFFHRERLSFIRGVAIRFGGGRQRPLSLLIAAALPLVAMVVLFDWRFLLAYPVLGFAAVLVGWKHSSAPVAVQFAREAAEKLLESEPTVATLLVPSSRRLLEGLAGLPLSSGTERVEVVEERWRLLAGGQGEAGAPGDGPALRLLQAVEEVLVLAENAERCSSCAVMGGWGVSGEEREWGRLAEGVREGLFFGGGDAYVSCVDAVCSGLVVVLRNLDLGLRRAAHEAKEGEKRGSAAPLLQLLEATAAGRSVPGSGALFLEEDEMSKMLNLGPEAPSTLVGWKGLWIANVQLDCQDTALHLSIASLASHLPPWRAAASAASLHSDAAFWNRVSTKAKSSPDAAPFLARAVRAAAFNAALWIHTVRPRTGATQLANHLQKVVLKADQHILAPLLHILPKGRAYTAVRNAQKYSKKLAKTYILQQNTVRYSYSF